MIGPRTVNALAALLAVAGIGLLGYVAYVDVDARVHQRHARARLVVEAHEVPREGRARREGDVLGEIQNGRVGLSAVISEGESDAVLRHSVGHLPGTAALGGMGNAALAGHRDGLFRPLKDIRVGDVLVVTAGGRETAYDVEWTRVVPPSDMWVLGPTSGRVLTLITCHPFSFIGAAPNRFIVRARGRVVSD